MVRNGIENFKDFEVSYKGETIKELYATVIELKNTGDVPIDSSMISKKNPIRISKGHEDILSFTIRKTLTTEDVDFNPIKMKEGVLFNFDILNPNDTITITALHLNPKIEIEVSGSGKAFKKLKEKQERMGRREKQFKKFVLNETKTRFDEERKRSIWKKIIPLFFLVFIIILCIICLIKDKEK